MSGVKQLLFRYASAVVAPRVLHRLALPQSLTILTYHGVVNEPLPVADRYFMQAEPFRRQLTYLARHFDVLPLAEAVRRLRAGELRRPAAAITFDDGYRNNHDVALPILRELGLPATIFLATGFIGSDAMLWFCHLNRALAQTERTALAWNGLHYDISTPRDRAAASAALQHALKRLDHEAMLNETGAILAQLGCNAAWPAEPDSPFHMLDAAQVRSMADEGLIEFGAHTVQHTILTRVDPKRAASEIADSIAATAELSGRPCRLFAYPNGGKQDFGPAHEALLAEHGIECAVSSVEGPNLAPQVAPFRLKRTDIGSNLTDAAYHEQLHHIPSLVRGLKS